MFGSYEMQAKDCKAALKVFSREREELLDLVNFVRIRICKRIRMGRLGQQRPTIRRKRNTTT